MQQGSVMQKVQKIRNVVGHVRLTWDRLSDKEVASYEAGQRQFYDAVRQRYGLSPAEIENQIRVWEREPARAAA